MPDNQPHVPIRTEAITRFCQKYQIRELALFGSVLRDDFTSRSDVDVLIDLPQNTGLSLFDLPPMARALRRIFGRKVDICFKDTLHRVIRDDVLASRLVLCALPKSRLEN